MLGKNLPVILSNSRAFQRHNNAVGAQNLVASRIVDNYLVASKAALRPEKDHRYGIRVKT